MRAELARLTLIAPTSAKGLIEVQQPAGVLARLTAALPHCDAAVPRFSRCVVKERQLLVRDEACHMYCSYERL
ncbi:MAG: hypothetical protein DMF84_06550 [Acidobacteria bacterium]|nr:MAG: hypothetical protein DMF84_06550 [Acidobacteriota bacterium]